MTNHRPVVDMARLDSTGSLGAPSRGTRQALGLLLAGLAVYGLFGEPLPNKTQVWVLAVGGLVGAYTLRSFSAVRRRPSLALLVATGWAVGILGCIGSVVGSAVSVQEFAEDLAPHIALVATLVVAGSPSRIPPAWRMRAPVWAMGAGVLICLRFLRTAHINADALGLIVQDFDGLLRLNFDPLVVFSGVLGLHVALYPRLYRSRPNRFASMATRVGGLTAMGLATTAAMAGLTRGSLALQAVGWLAVLLVGRRHGDRPARSLLLLAGLAVFVVVQVIGSTQSDVLTSLVERNQQLGANGRWNEALAVGDILSDPAYALVGKGWGSLVGPNATSYLHSFPLYYAAKAGIAGVIFALAALWRLVTLVRGVYGTSPPVAVALAASASNALVFQPTFKSIGFLLMLITASTAFAPEPRSPSEYPSTRGGQLSEVMDAL